MSQWDAHSVSTRVPSYPKNCPLPEEDGATAEESTDIAMTVAIPFEATGPLFEWLTLVDEYCAADPTVLEFDKRCSVQVLEVLGVAHGLGSFLLYRTRVGAKTKPSVLVASTSIPDNTKPYFCGVPNLRE